MPENVPAERTPEAALFQMIVGMKVSQAVYVAAKLNVFDLLQSGPKTALELASAAGAHAPTLGRLLRFLTMFDVLTEDAQGRFTATSVGALLCADHPHSLRPLALLSGSQPFWRSWGDLHQSVLTGEVAFDRV